MTKLKNMKIKNKKAIRLFFSKTHSIKHKVNKMKRLKSFFIKPFKEKIVDLKKELKNECAWVEWLQDINKDLHKELEILQKK